MLYEVGHTLRYEYAAPVTLNTQILRLLPRSGGAQRLVSLRYDIQPAPVLCARQWDVFGNDVIQAWFNGSTDRLSIQFMSQVETQRTNPFDFVATHPGFPIDDGAATAALAPFRPPVAPDKALDALCKKLRTEAKDSSVEFPFLLCRMLFSEVQKVRREDGSALSPSETWRLKCGACRDTTVLFIDLCRRAGFAARFVSGYYCGDVADRQSRDLHAWAEVYMEGGGWRGYDPTTGLAAAGQHIALAHAAAPELAASVEGTYSGSAIAQMRYAVSIAPLNTFPYLPT